MKCLRCGYCCIMYDVVIVSPEYIVVDLEIDENNYKEILIHKPSGQPCPHLKYKSDGKYHCMIHHYDWYKTTPCHSHGQVETSVDDNCRMGEYIISNQQSIDMLKHIYDTGSKV